MAPPRPEMGETTSEPPGYVRAAQYLRMSTERQQYSISNQAEALQQYAATHGMLIVRTYADEGKSGLTVRGRPALEQLLQDVQSGTCPFDTLLVYDVSRWGRFQDADEAAFYEHLCRRAGVALIYCAETFANDASPMSSIVKAMKRVMAGEYSRELSHKIWVGQAEMVKRGYKSGGPAVFGLRRMMVDKDGNPKGLLDRGETKALQNDRVIYVPGPPEEVAAVQRVFRLFAEGWNLRRLAKDLNTKGLLRPTGSRWYGDEVRRMLRCEAYIGNNVYNRRSRKLKQAEVWNRPEEWIRCDGAFVPIIDPALFRTVRGILDERAALYDARRSRTELTMLAEVQELAERTGRLHFGDLDEALRFKGDAYRQRLGGVLKIRQRLGLSGPRDRHFLVDMPARKALRQTLLDELEAGFRASGASVERKRSPRLIVDGQLSILVYLAAAYLTPKGGATRWTVRFDRVREADVILCVRLAPGSNAVHDYLLIDEAEAPTEILTFGEEPRFDRLRLSSLADLYCIRGREDVPDVRLSRAAGPLRVLRLSRHPKKRRAPAPCPAKPMD